MSWVTSLRLPPVSETASGMPCASVITWCFEPGRARSTGLGPVLGRPSSPGCASRRSPPWTSPKRPRRAARPAAIRAAAARYRPRASPAAAASRSSPSRSPAPAAGTPTESPCTGRTRCRTGPSGVTFDGKLGGIIASANTGARLQVTLRWRGSAEPATATYVGRSSAPAVVVHFGVISPDRGKHGIRVTRTETRIQQFR
jgi:hypothetical protein